MASIIPNSGLLFVENSILGEATATINTVALGTDTTSPSKTDTDLNGQVYSATASENNVVIETTQSVGEIRFSVEVTSGTEIPSNADISEFGIKASDGTLLYREVRASPISFSTGETSTIQIKLKFEDTDIEQKQAVTNSGLNRIADILLGNSTNYINIIAVGGSTNDVSQTDTVMFDELSRAGNNASNVTLESTTNVGELLAQTIISAGSEIEDQVPDDTDISEFGILTSDSVLVFHETRAPVTLRQGNQETFEIPFEIEQ